MKKLFVFFVLILNLWGDTLPPEGFHYVSRKTHISNVSQYSNYVLIGYVKVISGEVESKYLIEDNVALDRGYKFNSFYIFAMTHELFEASGGLDNIDFETLAEQNGDCNTYTAQPAEGNKCYPFPYEYYTSDDNCSVVHDDYYYEIESIDDANVTFKLQKRVLTDDNGHTQTINY